MVKWKLFLGTSGCVGLAWLGGALGNSYINSLNSASHKLPSQEFDDTSEENEVIQNNTPPPTETQNLEKEPKPNTPDKEDQKPNVGNQKVEIPETEEVKKYKQQLLHNVELTNIIALLSNPTNQQNDKQTTEEKIKQDYETKLKSFHNNDEKQIQTLTQSNAELKKKLNSISEKRKQLIETRKAYKLILDALFQQFQNPDKSDKLEIILTKQKISNWDAITPESSTTFTHEGDDLKKLTDLFTYKGKSLIPKKQIHDFYYSEQENSIQEDSYEAINFSDKTMTDNVMQSHSVTNYIDSATFKEAQFEHDGSQYFFAVRYYTNNQINLFTIGLLDAQKSITETQDEIANVAGNSDKWLSLDY